MTERSPLIQQAFQDEPLQPGDRERLWTTMEHRHGRQARWRNLMLAAVLLLAGAIVAGALVVRNAIRSTSSFDRDLSGPIVVAADSISTDSPVEASVTQETRAEVPSNLIPLLGHRSGLAIDLANQTARREVLAERINRIGPGAQHASLVAELESVERQIHSTQIAIEVIDRQLAGHHEPLPAVPPVEAITVEPPQFYTVPNPADGEMIALVGGIGAILILSMVAVVSYIRRLSRTLKEALVQIENQVSSQHATLASGIDAIAVEVERLGEGQRFMSKVLTPELRAEAKR